MKRILRLSGLFTILLFAVNYVIDQTALIDSNASTITQITENAGNGTGTCVGKGI